MRIACARDIGPDQRTDQDHGGAGGADHTRDRGPESEDAHVDPRRAAKIAGHENAAGDDIEREQQDDEAEIFGDRGVNERRQGGLPAERRRQWQQGQDSPAECDLPIMTVPNSRKQQWASGDRQENASERQRPRPGHGGARQARGGKRGLRHEQQDCRKRDATGAGDHRQALQVRDICSQQSAEGL